MSLLLLKLPYRCTSCGQRFHVRSRKLTGVAAVLAVLICYPLSYHQLAAKYQSSPTVKTIYQPLMWVEEQMLTSHGNPPVPGT